MSDVFSGYGKAVRETNYHRVKQKRPLIKNIYCNAHARRKFKEAVTKFEAEGQYFIEVYKKIYRLEKIAQRRPSGRALRARRYMKPLFEKMNCFAEKKCCTCRLRA